MIYLDNNASTPVDPEVSDAVFSSLRREYGNPSSSHDIGRKARAFLDACRGTVADFLGCLPDEVIFTSGGTESNNLAVIGTALQHGKGHIAASAMEHPSVARCCAHLRDRGFSVTLIETDANGIISLEQLKKALRKETILVTVMHANNETGVVQPIEEIGLLTRERGIAFHTDAAQTIGKIPFTLRNSGVDMLTVASHKFYGPKGVGALIVRNSSRIRPILYGADHEKGMRPGTENIPGIAGLAKACQIAARDIRMRVSHSSQLRDLMMNLLKDKVADIRLNGHPMQRLPNTLNVVIPGIQSNILVEQLRDKVAISAGSACHAGVRTASAPLLGLGLSEAEALSSVRISAGKDNTKEEIEEAAVLITRTVQELRKKAPQT